MTSPMSLRNDSEKSELDLHDHLLFLGACRVAAGLGLHDAVTLQRPFAQVEPDPSLVIKSKPSTCTTNTSSLQSNSTGRQVQQQRRWKEWYQLLNEKQKFVVFVKALFKILDGRNELFLLRIAKEVVTKCVESNRMGDHRYMPLYDITVTHLRLAVGERYWAMAVNYLKSKA